MVIGMEYAGWARGVTVRGSAHELGPSASYKRVTIVAVGVRS